MLKIVDGRPFCLDDSIAICINVNMLIVSRVSSAEDGSEFSNKECPAFSGGECSRVCLGMKHLCV